MKEKELIMKEKYVFQCQRCGKCCEILGLPYDGFHIYELADFLGIDTDTLMDRYYGTAFIKENGEKAWTLDDNKRHPCPFLAEDKTCKVYPVRPDPCRAYPLRTDFGRCGVKCPAIGRKRPYNFRFEGEK